MAENNNQNTVDRQQVEQLNSIPLEPVRDKVVFCHYSSTFVNTFAFPLTFIWNSCLEHGICFPFSHFKPAFHELIIRIL